MSERVIWSSEARADIRAIDRDTALRLLKALDRFLKTDASETSSNDQVLNHLCFFSASATGVLFTAGAVTTLRQRISVAAGAVLTNRQCR